MLSLQSIRFMHIVRILSSALRLTISLKLYVSHFIYNYFWQLLFIYTTSGSQDPLAQQCTNTSCSFVDKSSEIINETPSPIVQKKNHCNTSFAEDFVPGK